jgi:hypothetical protein
MNYLYSYSRCRLSVFLFPPFFSLSPFMSSHSKPLPVTAVLLYFLLFSILYMFPFPFHIAPFLLLVPFLFFIFVLLLFSRQLVNWPRYKLRTSHNLHYPAQCHILIHVLLSCVT